MATLQTLTAVAPAAGAEISWTAPAAPQQAKIVAIRFQLVTSAAVANRRPRFFFQENSAAPLEFWRASAVADQPAATTITYSLAANQNAAVNGGVHGLGLPVDLWVSPGFAFKSSTTLIDVGDQYSALTVVVLA